MSFMHGLIIRAGMHGDGNFAGFETVLMQHDNEIGVGKVRRIMIASRELNGLSLKRLKPGSRIGYFLSAKKGSDAPKDKHPQMLEDSGLVFVFAQEPRADHDVQIFVLYFLQHVNDVARIVLSIGVHLHHRGVAVFQSENKSRLQSHAVAGIEGKRDDFCAIFPGNPGGGVPGTVIDHQNRKLGSEPSDALKNLADVFFLIVCGNDDQGVGKPDQRRRDGGLGRRFLLRCGFQCSREFLLVQIIQWSSALGSEKETNHHYLEKHVPNC